MSRHRIRYLAAKGEYVCSKRYCAYSSPNLTEAMAHTVNENKAVAPTEEPRPDAAKAA